MDRTLDRSQSLGSFHPLSPPPYSLSPSLTEMESKIKHSELLQMFTQNYMQEQSRFSFFLSVFLPHSSAVFLSPSKSCASLPSFALQVVALCLAPLLAVEARQRLPILVHAPAVSPPPALGWTALQTEMKEKK